MRLSINLILVLITCSALRPDLVVAEKAAKTRQVAEKGLEGQKHEEKLQKKTPQGEHKHKIVAKYKDSESEEDSDESDEEPPRKNYKIKQKDVAETRSKKNVGVSSEEEEKREVKKGRWNENYKNHKTNHVDKGGKVKFAPFPAGTSVQNLGKEDSDEKEEKKPPKSGHKKTSVDKEGAKKYLKEKNDKGLKGAKNAAKKAQDDDDDDDDDSSEETGPKSATKNKQEADLKPFAKVRKSSVVKKQKPKKIEVDDDDDSDDTEESRNDSDDDSKDTEESDDDDDDSEDKDSLQCDSVEEDCDS